MQQNRPAASRRGHSPGHHAPSGESVADFARRYGLELLRFAYLLCGNRHTAEDLLQEVFLNMYRRFPDKMPLDNPVGYARRALAHANISRARRMASTEVISDMLGEAASRMAMGAPASTQATYDDDLAERDLLWHALERLPLRQRTVLVLRYYADATNADIATSIGARPGAVRSLASRGLAALRRDRAIGSANEGDQP